jgi:hypothetical protein
MASIDLNLDYKEAQKKIEASKSYKDLKQQYDDTVKRAGESFEQKKENVTKSLDQVKEQQKRFQREIKTQFEQLLDINNVTGGKGSNSIAYVKKLLLKTIKNIEPKIAEILNEESLNAVGCDEQQTFTQQILYIKVSSTDLINLLKKDPNSDDGKVLYEKNPLVVQDRPFAMNKELYQRIQSGNPYSVDNGQVYKGQSGQNLFDIQYVEFNNFGETGPWFKVTLFNRLNNVNKVGSFLKDYYQTIKVVDFTNIMAYIMEGLSGCLSIQANVGFTQSEDTTKFAAIIQRILGLCFDNTKEIDVSGIAKIAELDGIDDSFFEFNEIDLRNIEQRISNVKNGVAEFLSCENVKLPVNYFEILDNLNQLNFVADNDLVAAADSLTETMANNPAWSGFAIEGNIKAELDLNFVKLMVNGIIMSVLSPKVLLPIFIMLKSLGNTFMDKITSLMDFAKEFKTFFINIASKIGAIFIKELFELIKKDIKNLLQSIIRDVAKEKIAKKYIIILKLIQLLLVVAEFISDWRRCKSVIDEILWLLKIATSGWGGDIPLPLLFGSQLLDGYSESRAFIGAIEQLQKLGIPTGPLPDGSPNLDVLKMFGQMKAMSTEESENGKVQIAIGPLTMTPAGLTVPTSAFGKKL